eukprot:695539-Karenia_brevis.AAC.1
MGLRVDLIPETSSCNGPNGPDSSLGKQSRNQKQGNWSPESRVRGETASSGFQGCRTGSNLAKEWISGKRSCGDSVRESFDIGEGPKGKRQRKEST